MCADAATSAGKTFSKTNGSVPSPEEYDIPRRKARAAGLLFAFASLQYLLLEALTASRSEGYRYAYDTVSDLGVPTTSDTSWLMNVAFCVSAISVLAAGICSASLLGRRRWVYLGAIAAYSLGSVLVAVVHAGDGNTHIIGAVLAIGAGNIIALLVGTGVPTCPRWYSRGSVGLGVLGFVASGLLIAGVGPVGVMERASIYTFTGWELLTAAALGLVVARTRH
ncbi:hypothetical protein BJD99_19850 [Rhodococcus sp. 1163]|uniref:DUF998 domain-containing protein n=1 Tax=Rhodococcus sp. 1163 TaxID=1905289 RepID=UPI000A053EA1|nr:DUF998 domain-containing protein [Rhodococcus sp. 1163]ORI18968.1 hypothetical protein BJD99_19850 [Rhodococcus sp. 1163]